MGNFSRDPGTRSEAALARHYVAVRLQQGVPLLDADWNELDDLRRLELQELAQAVIGDGVPPGNDGFRIVALPDGGVGTIVLAAKVAGEGLSKLAIDLGASSAAAALGFDARNAAAERLGSSPARLTGRKTGPFQLAAGATLVIKANDLAPEKVTFAGTETTAAQVTAAINAGLANASAATGDGGDFVIRGGNGTLAGAGRILAGGKMAHIETDLTYTAQPLYANAALEKAWGVPSVPPLDAAANESYAVYLDVWEREVDPMEDQDLVDGRIGVETANRLRREWAVRVAKLAQYSATLAAAPKGHAYVRLARIARAAGKGIETQMIADEREIDLALLRDIAYRGLDGTVLVTTAEVRNALVTCRDRVRGFILYLGIAVPIRSGVLLGEMLGFQALERIAALADVGIALIDTRVLSTRSALSFFAQLRDTERTFVLVWMFGVLPLVKPMGSVYGAYAKALTDISQHVAELDTALVAGDLEKALAAQNKINEAFGNEANKPTGSLRLTYLGSETPAVNVTGGQAFDVRYRVTGTVKPADKLKVEISLDLTWESKPKNLDGSDFDMEFGPQTGSKEFLIGIKPPAGAAAAAAGMTVKISASGNPEGLYYFSTQKSFNPGHLPPPGEESFAFQIESITATPEGGLFTVKVGQKETATFRLMNNTNASVPVLLRAPTASAWKIVAGTFADKVGAHNFEDFSFQFTAPATADNQLDFQLTATSGGTEVASATITLKSVA